MVEQVNNLLLNLLISGRGVFLPSVGSLYTRFGGARLLSGRKVERGVREVVYTPQERGVSLIDAIAEAGGCNRAEAADIYARWLSHTLAGEVLTVEGVGELRQQCFTPDPALERLFNLLGKAPVTLHRTTHRGRRIAVATGVVLLLAAGSAYLALFGDDLPGGQTIREWVASAGDAGRPTTVSGADRASAGFPDAQSGGRSADDPLSGETAGTDERPQLLADSTAAEKSDADARTDMRVDSPGSAGTTDPAVLSARSAASGVPADREASAQPALSAGDAVQESGRGAGIAAPSSGERNVSGTVGGRRDVPLGEPARMSAGRTYLVLGVYSTADNARRAARETVAKNPEIVPHIYFFGDKFMVSIGTYDSRDEATEAIRAYGSRFRGLWPYSKK
ncbi:hypothetical protein [uncultured Alistipes sp.]|uniref:hypothetical protein n=1 Tax=uncultured Alistipes sp. TaxID=538949 RepID=UPI00266CD498|nr:hypothetical protein [uncultured Alistipes sp.]